MRGTAVSIVPTPALDYYHPMRKRRLIQALKFALFAFLALLLLAPEWPAFGDERYQLKTLVNLRQFDFWTWEAQAITTKAQSLLANNQAYLTEAQQKAFVLEFMAHVAQVQQLDGQLTTLLADPDAATRQAEAQALQADLEHARAQVVARQDLAEAIVQDQVAWALRESGFQVLGQAWPPVLAQMTPLPQLLVVSPRDKIESRYQVSLISGLSALDMDGLETAVLRQLDLSALVVPLGGLGTYPAMIAETSNLPWLIEVVAHEWTHHWLTLQPLGLRYAQDPQMRIINETAASMVDVEIRDMVLQRFYPELYQPPTPTEPPPETTASEPPAFDFRAEMAKTRIEVDRLLGEGDVVGAEAHMEARRLFFVANGYPIRKLNQAYFAFYGAYAAEPGATGSDPIGPMLRSIRQGSPSLYAFLQTIAPVRNYGQLEEIFAEIIGG